jgi:hypothetical protein
MPSKIDAIFFLFHCLRALGTAKYPSNRQAALSMLLETKIRSTEDSRGSDDRFSLMRTDPLAESSHSAHAHGGCRMAHCAL